MTVGIGFASCRRFMSVHGAQACAEYVFVLAKCSYSALGDRFMNIGAFWKNTELDDALWHGVTKNRGGRGTVYVFAASNEFAKGEDVNALHVQKSRFTIAVGAVGKRGAHAFYSDAGAAVFVVGPGDCCSRLTSV